MDNEKNIMDFDVYQEEVTKKFKKHVMMTPSEARLLNWILGLTGETGELVNIMKHDLFHHERADKMVVAKEIGDILWYLAAICDSLNIPLAACAELNVLKLNHRHGAGYSAKGSADRKQKEIELLNSFEYQMIESKIRGGGFDEWKPPKTT